MPGAGSRRRGRQQAPAPESESSRRRPFEGRKNQGTTTDAVSRADLETWLTDLGDDGARARLLDEWVQASFDRLQRLTTVSTPLAGEYVPRLRVPMPSLAIDTGYELIRRGYLAHLGAEADPATYGADEVPPAIALPEMGPDRQPPRGLLNKLSRLAVRQFEPLLAIPLPTWDGLVVATTYRLHQDIVGSGDGQLLPSMPVVDGLLRFGWLLRTVDVTYGLSPPGWATWPVGGPGPTT